MMIRTQFGNKTFTRRLPENVSERDKQHFLTNQKYVCKPLLIFQFKEINLLPDSTLFRWIFPLDLSFLFFRKKIRHHNIKGILYIIFKWKRITLGGDKPFLVIHDPWTKNYYHWFTQALPRLLLAQELNRSFILLLPEDHQSEFHMESLKFLKVDSWQIIKRGERYYTIQNLLYPAHDIQIGDYNDDLIRLLRQKINFTTKDQKIARRIFIRRRARDKRQVINEEEVLSTFRLFGFEIIEFERFPLREQIALAASADVLAGVHGAGLTNMIFMPAGSTVFELTSQLNGDHYYYYTLSNALSHKYYYQLCEATTDDIIQEADLIVDINSLKNNIIAILKP